MVDKDLLKLYETLKSQADDDSTVGCEIYSLFIDLLTIAVADGQLAPEQLAMVENTGIDEMMS